MDKNENGYPIVDGRAIGGDGGCNMGNGCGVGGHGNGGCGGTSPIDSYPLAYVYAPNQNFRLLYSAEEALKHGTLFEELYKPKEVYGRE
jgi:hypothetical protein